MSLVWGVRTFYYDQLESTDKTIHDVNNILKAENLVEEGDVVINTASAPIFKQGKTNMLKVTVIE
jgi:pyruvate kinase